MDDFVKRMKKHGARLDNPELAGKLYRAHTLAIAVIMLVACVAGLVVTGSLGWLVIKLMQYFGVV